MSDPINHPKHYNSHPSGVEAITVCEHHNFNIGNAIKYLWRAGLKDNVIQDLEKARWYVDREIARLKAKPRPSTPTARRFARRPGPPSRTRSPSS